MAQVLPYVPSFLEQLAPHLEKAAGDIGSGLQQRSALRGLQALLNPQQSTPAAEGQNGQQGTQQSSVSPAGGLSPLQNVQAYNLAEKAFKSKGAANAFTNSLIEKQKVAERANLQERKFEKQQATKAEPDLLERETKLNHYEQEGARFERLQELFSPDLENKFPSAFTVGLLTKDGELRPTAAASLSPEAQEAVKLVADNLSGAKDTFGARVTNFDLQAYMKRLPTLLNTSEGRRRVLRDLRLMNKLNTNHEQGVLDIVDREGGPERISLSQAERRYRKEHAQEIAQIRKEFVSPEKHVFTERPDPKVYSGRSIIDEETGERLKSNGKEWVPEQ